MEPISFGTTSLVGVLSNNPTAIDYSKTGNPTLFVVQQDGDIYRYEIERQPDGGDADDIDDFVATDTLLIDIIPENIQNYNDDGSINTNEKRQVTGLVVTKDAAGNDVLYVASSDWRIAVGNDSGLDTNSSQIHRITLDPDTGAVLESVAILRGLPRSEENHAVNGLDLSVDPTTGDTYLWFAVGGITNKGAPGNNFAGTTEFAWSGTVSKINLTELESFDIRTDGQGDDFIVDLSTLDDPSRPNVDLSGLGIANLAADPNFTLDNNGTGTNGELNPDWAGGNNGLNQAKITDFVLASIGGQLQLVSNPVSVHSPGFRNSYDVLITSAGEVFTWDNGPNGGWGGQPLSFSDGNIVDDWTSEFATNEFNESGSNGFGDSLHYLGNVGDEYGPYGGHAAAIRAAKEALDAAFDQNGNYKGATSSDPIIAHGVQLFANETEARDYLSKLLIIYEEQGDGNWVDITGATGLPPDLFDIVSGYDWTHPGSTLSNPLTFFDGSSVMDGTAFSPESQLLTPAQDGSLLTLPESTNGLAEYTATFFGGQLQGTILSVDFDQNLYFTELLDSDSNGRTDAASVVHTVGNLGTRPLGLMAFGDQGFGPTLIDNNGDGIDDFAGLVLVASHGTDSVLVLVPGGTPTGPGNDLDDDGLDNVEDSHVGDPLNGKGVNVTPGTTALWDFELNNPATTPPGAVPPGGSIQGDIGINAAWRDGITPAINNLGNPSAGLYDTSVFNLGGASSFISLDRAHDGTAEGSANTQRDVLGIGFTAASGSSVSVTTEMVNIFTYSLNTDAPAKTWDGGEKVGLFVGPGDQSNYAEATIAVIDDNGTIRYGVQLIVETNDTFVTSFVEIPDIENPVISGLGDPNFQVAIDLNLTPGSETATARARFVDNGAYTDWVATSALALPAAVVQSVRGQFDIQGTDVGAVVGMVASADTGDDSFAASWDWIEVDNGNVFGTGAATLGIRENSDNIQVSNFGNGSFVLTNTGQKVITKVELDVSSAILPDAVFDPFGLAGDTVSKALTIDSAGNTGIIAPNNDPNDPNNDTYVGAGGIAGFEGIVLEFDQGVNGGFEPGEILTFSVDMDPNSVAGAKKSLLDAGSNPFWDVGGISGAELIGSTFTVTYSDGTTSTGRLHGTNNQGGSKGVSTQSLSDDEVALTVNGLTPGGVGTYVDGGPTVIVNGTAGQTARIVLVKGFIQPVTNEFYNGNSEDQAYAPQLDAQLAALSASVFPVNNAVEIQTVDVVLTGGNQDISSLFDFSGVADYDFTGEDEVPLGFVGAVIDPSDGNLPLGPVTDAIYLTFNDGSGDVTPPSVSAASSPNLGVGAAGSATTTVTVTFADNVAVDVSTIDVGDITVTGPGGALSVTGVSVNNGTDGTPRTATYTVSAPGGTWDGADDGVYTVAMDGAEVFDTSGNAVAANGSLTGFNVNISSPPTGDPFRVEAESMNIVTGFSVQSIGVASSGQVLKANGSGEQRASYVFADAAGTYDVTIGYFDESDGQSSMSLLVNGSVVDSFIWNQDPGGPYADGDAKAEYTVSGVVLSAGDLVEISGVKDGPEPLRTDYLDFLLTGTGGGGDTTAPTVSAASSPNLGVGAAGSATTTVTVTFADNVAVDVSTIDVGDITVTGPGGALSVTGVSVNNGTDGTPRTATYTVSAPGGTWDGADDGVYTVAMDGAEVFDTSGNAVAANGSLTVFSVNVSTPPGGDPFRIEAESMTIESGFSVQSIGAASGNQVLKANGSGEQSASFIFANTTGSYDVTIGYFDESDGQSTMSLLVNGVVVDTFIWNQDPGGPFANGDSLAEYTVSDVALTGGDVVEISGFKDGGEPLRTDYLDFMLT